MDIERMFEDGARQGLFTDFDVCVRGPYEASFKGGSHVSTGARFFDIASITKALTHLLLLRLFAEEVISPDDKLTRFLAVPNSGDRRLWHFMSYLAKEYAFYLDYDKLRKGEVGSLRDTILAQGFGEWTRKFGYDNYSSVFLGVVLEKLFGANLEEVFHSELCCGVEPQTLFFHPTRRRMDASLFVPTTSVLGTRGVAFDLVTSAHSAECLSIAGVFSDASTVVSIFHRTLEQIIRSGFYSIASRNYLEGVDDTAQKPWGLGFDIPVTERNLGPTVGPMIFSGYTGCRIFFSEKPRLTMCILTNRVFCGNTVESRERFSDFSWNVIREALHRAR